VTIYFKIDTRRTDLLSFPSYDVAACSLWLLILTVTPGSNVISYSKIRTIFICKEK